MSQKMIWGAYEKSIAQWLEKADKLSLVQRLWEKDASLWSQDSEVKKEIVRRLGWLELVKPMKREVGSLTAFADEIKKEGFEKVLLLGMGGSSLAPEMFQAVFGNKKGSPELLTLDSTDPLSVRDVESKVNIEKTLFIVSSKSGGTLELLSFFKYFFAKAKEKRGDEAGRQFVAITDSGTPLARLAEENNFRRVFLAPEDVGGRFSALTFFGLVPAALIGVDVAAVLEGAEKMVARTSPIISAADNPAALLGVAMAILAEEGRDKLTVVTEARFESFGDWAEQLVAESTGKEELGIIPVVREPLEEPAVYGEDRFFVALLSDSEEGRHLEKRLEAFQKQGHPVLTLKIKDERDLGAEFFRWEMATAIACALMKINAFDQPDVQAAKDRAKALLKSVESGKTLDLKPSEISAEAFESCLKSDDYVAILAFLPDQEMLRGKLNELRFHIRNRTKLAVTLGLGPRYLHSTGQLHKGGPNIGAFLLMTVQHTEDLPIPGEKYSFGQLESAQALGDFEALHAKGRRVFHLRLEDLSETHLTETFQKIQMSIDAAVL